MVSVHHSMNAGRDTEAFDLSEQGVFEIVAQSGFHAFVV
jgi:hypothetical protein